MALSPLGHSLHFGRVAGALAMLRKRGDIGEADAIRALTMVEVREAAWAGTWERINTAG